MGGFFDRHGQRLIVFDVDGTRQAARQRALAASTELPAPQRRLDAVCAPGYTGRQRGEVVRTRTTVLQAHTQAWLGSFSGPGNGDYAQELQDACQVITGYLAAKGLKPSQALIRLDGLYGTTSLLAQLQPFQLGFLTRGRDYQLLDHPTVQARLQQPCDLTVTHLESQVQREIFEVGFLADWLAERPEVVIPYRVVLTRRIAPVDRAQITVGKLRGDYVYELFLTAHPASSLPAATILELYQHRGSFEQVLSDEDHEQAPDRWCSQRPCGQEFWQILSQWVWNTRLELGSVAQPQPLRWTTWDAEALVPPALPMLGSEPVQESAAPTAAQSASDVVRPTSIPDSATPITAELVPTYGPLVLAQPWAKARHRFSAQDFIPREDDTLECPAGKVLRPQERRKLETGDLRVLYAAKAHDCRTCNLASECLGRGASGEQPRRVSGVRRVVGWQLQPRSVAEQPATLSAEGVHQMKAGQQIRVLQWSDVGGRRLRRDLVRQLRRQQVSITGPLVGPALLTSGVEPWVGTRAERAHRRRSWASRLARNARAADAPGYCVTLYGVAPALAAYLGVPSVSAS